MIFSYNRFCNRSILGMRGFAGLISSKIGAFNLPFKAAFSFPIDLMEFHAVFAPQIDWLIFI